MSSSDDDRLIATAWRRYLTRVIPRSAPPTQITESRRSFYAGAYSLLVLLREVNDEMTDDAGVALLQSVDDELRAFAIRVAEGRA